MENKNKGYRLKIVVLLILALIVRAEFYLIATQSLNQLLEREGYNESQHNQPEKTITVHLAGLGDFILRNTGKGYVGMRPVIQQTEKGLVIPEISAARKDIFKTLNSDTSEGAQLRGALGLESGKKINVQPDTPVRSQYVDPEISSLRTNTGRDVNIPNSEQAVRIEEATNAVRLTEKSVEQKAKDINSSWKIADEVDNIMGSPFDANKAPTRGYGGSFGDQLIAGSSKLERWSAETGKWEEIVMPESVKAKFGAKSSPGDMDIGATPRAEGFQEGQFLNEKTGEMFDGLKISDEQFQKIREIPEVEGYFGKGLDEVKGVLPAYSKVGGMEHEFWRVTSADGTMQTVVLDPYRTTLPSRTVFAGTTKMADEGVSKVGKFNEYEELIEGASRTGYFENGILKPYSDVVEQRTREYIEAKIASFKDDPAELAKFQSQYAKIMDDASYSPEFREWIKESTRGLFPESSEVSSSPFTKEFLEGVTPITLGELGEIITDPENLENASQIAADQHSYVPLDSDTPSSGEWGPSTDILKNVYNRIIGSDNGILAGQHAYSPLDSEDIFPNPESRGNSTTWGQIVNSVISSAIPDPLSGTLLGEISQSIVDGTKGTYDINSNAYKILVQPPAVGTIPTDPNHPLNSPEIKAIMENEKISSAVPDYRSTWEKLNPWGPTKEDKYAEVTAQKYEEERLALEKSQEEQRKILDDADRGAGAMTKTDGQRESTEGDRSAESYSDFWDQNEFAGPMSPEAPPVSDKIANQTLPEIPTDLYKQPEYPTEPLPDYGKYVSGNGSSGSPYDLKDTKEGKELMDKIYEFDPETGEVKLKDKWEEAMKDFKGNIKPPTKEEFLDRKLEKGEITQKQKDDSMKKGKDITVPNGTTVQDEKNRRYTADDNPESPKC